MEELIQTGFRGNKEDIDKINNWCVKNRYSMGLVYRKSIKDFITNYIDAGIIPDMKEKLNKGCIKIK